MKSSRTLCAWHHASIVFEKNSVPLSTVPCAVNALVPMNHARTERAAIERLADLPELSARS
jgi:hypothetical protein